MYRLEQYAAKTLRRRLLAGAFILAIGATAVGLPSTLADQPSQPAPVGQVVKLRGSAEITRGRLSLPLPPGAALQAGDVVKTGAGTRLKLQFIDGSTIALGENAELKITEFTVADAPNTRAALMTLTQGTLHALAAKAGPGSRFEIRTNLAYSAVRGTEWFVIATATETDVAVVTGRVGVGLAKISAESAVSIGRQAKIAVGAETGLEDPRMLSDAELADLLSKTDSPEADLPFDLGTAPALAFPIAVPGTGGPELDKPNSEIQGKKRDCLRTGAGGCSGRGNDKDHDSRGGGSSHDHDHDSDHDSGT